MWCIEWVIPDVVFVLVITRVGMDADFVVCLLGVRYCGGGALNGCS